MSESGKIQQKIKMAVTAVWLPGQQLFFDMSVDVFSVSDPDNKNKQYLFFYRISNSVIARANTA